VILHFNKGNLGLIITIDMLQYWLFGEIISVKGDCQLSGFHTQVSKREGVIVIALVVQTSHTQFLVQPR